MTGGVFTDGARDFLAGVPNVVHREAVRPRGAARDGRRALRGARRDDDGARRKTRQVDGFGGRNSKVTVQPDTPTNGPPPRRRTSSSCGACARCAACRASSGCWASRACSTTSRARRSSRCCPCSWRSSARPCATSGLIEGSADALASVIKMIAGRLSDRGPRRLMVAGGYALPAVARAGIALAAAPWHVLAARLLDRAGKGIRSGPRDAHARRLRRAVGARPRVRPQPLDGSPGRGRRPAHRQRAARAGRRPARDVRRRRRCSA